MSYDCTEIDKTQSPTLCEQAERFVDKLYNYPDDWECILETDYYVDCSKFLAELRKNEYLFRRAGYRINKYSYGQLKERKKTECYTYLSTEKFSEKYTRDGVEADILCVSIERIPIPDPFYLGSPEINMRFIFKIIDKQRLELIDIM
ncbi:MAG: hypothetical protein KAH48_05530 [Chlorobi bacterium]|nr:hypothetical protein [Chlorobiota bacterium]